MRTFIIVHFYMLKVIPNIPGKSSCVIVR
jgi:hypothetical protein